MALLGETAALAVAVLWAGGSLLFTASSRRIGAVTTNLYRITLAAGLLWAIRWLLREHTESAGLDARNVGWLVASGVIGLVAGDSCYFRSLVLIGTRRATLLMSSVPLLTALFAWTALGERLGLQAIAGMLVAIGGIAWVVVDRAPGGAGEGRTLAGSLLGLGGALGQALGLILAKPAMVAIDALTATAIRMSAAAVAIWLLAVGARRVGAWRRLADRRLLLALTAATVIGPCLGVWLSLVAVRHTETAVAATLMALVPVTVLPLLWLVHGERPSARAVLGSLVAVAGVGLVLLR